MDRKTTVLLVITLVVILGVIGGVGYFFQKSDSLVSSQTNKQSLAVETTPSKTLKAHSDEAGFSFNYPDNLSLTNNESEDPNTYSDLKLSAAGVDGSLDLKIMDSKLKTNEAWAKTISTDAVAKEVMLGNLKALEIETTEKLILGALDQGVLFTIEIPLNTKKDFWMEVYNKVIAEFTFIAPPPDNAATAPTTGSSSEVSFEGEEVVVE